MATETVTLTLRTDDDDDDLEVPTDLVDMLAEGDQSAPEVVGDVALFGLAQRVHSAVHHAQGEPDEEVRAVEETTMELFEDRFGVSFAEITGHDH